MHFLLHGVEAMENGRLSLVHYRHQILTSAEKTPLPALIERDTRYQ